ncbi:ComF family protein [Candidatus Cloacimonadota bacterium]
MKLLRSFLDLLFPPVCFSCSNRLNNSENFLCSGCENELCWLENICPVCGNKLEDNNCNFCSSNTWYFDMTFSLFAFNKVVQNLIHDLKYNDMVRVADLFYTYYKKYIEKNELFNSVDFVTPVPIHRVRRRSRGYNQAELLSGRIAEILDVTHLPELLKRKRYTATQTKLNREDRNKNVASAFYLNQKTDLTDKTILLVDDVFTTGSTVNSISKLLKENSCGKIFILTLSHA